MSLHRLGGRIELEPEALMVEGKWYGGRQAWLTEHMGIQKRMADRSCALAALGNVCLYLSRTREEYQALFPYPATEKGFAMVMRDIYGFLKPTVTGVFTLGMMQRQFEKYARSCGVSLRENNAQWKWTPPNVFEYIKSGLLYGSPVLMLTWNTSIRDLRNHWVVVTGLRLDGEQRPIILTSNWGYKKEYDLEEWVRRISLYRGLFYFT